MRTNCSLKLYTDKAVVPFDIAFNDPAAERYRSLSVQMECFKVKVEPLQAPYNGPAQDCTNVGSKITVSTSVKALFWNHSKFNVKVDALPSYEFTSYPTIALDANPFVFNFFGTKSCNLSQASHTFAVDALNPRVATTPPTVASSSASFTNQDNRWPLIVSNETGLCDSAQGITLNLSLSAPSQSVQTASNISLTAAARVLVRGNEQNTMTVSKSAAPDFPQTLVFTWTADFTGSPLPYEGNPGTYRGLNEFAIIFVKRAGCNQTPQSPRIAQEAAALRSLPGSTVSLGVLKGLEPPRRPGPRQSSTSSCGSGSRLTAAESPATKSRRKARGAGVKSPGPFFAQLAEL